MESRRIDPQSLLVIGKEKTREARDELVNRLSVTSLAEEKSAGRSLALIRPHDPNFKIYRKSSSRLSADQGRRDALLRQADMFAEESVSKEACPFEFRYRFLMNGRQATYRCIDWETEATFFKWRARYGEEEALVRMQRRWNDELPERGIVFAFGTHRVKKFNTWLLSAVIQAGASKQGSFL